MPVILDDLTPFPTYLLARAPKKYAGPAKLLDGLVTELEIGKSNVRRLIQGPRAKTERGLTTSFLIYSRTDKPAWLAKDLPSLADTQHHLLLVCQFGDLVCLYCSEPAATGLIATQLLAPPLEESDSLLGQLKPVEPDVLNGAFLTGPAKTLWLSGIHRRSATKPDSKVLAGANLKDALSPLGDQSYMFTAARSLATLSDLPSKKKSLSVGVVPRKSRVWGPALETWSQYRDTTIALLKRVAASTKPKLRNQAPIPILAFEMPGLAGVAGAYDMCLISPDLMDPSEVTDVPPAEIASLTKWSTEAQFQVTPQGDATVKATASLYGKPVAIVDIDWKTNSQGKASAIIDVQPTPNGSATYAQELRSVCRKPGWLTVYYESGHTFAGGRLYSVRYRDIPFAGWVFEDFAGYDVTKEKPGPRDDPDLDLIGSEDSLFCWISKRWPIQGEFVDRGWLTCDDGSGEIADFIHIGQRPKGLPVVTLIHAKGSHSDTANRHVSTSAYEVVTSQALKNLRFLDRSDLHDRLAKNTNRITWRNGKKLTSRSALLSLIKSFGSNYERRVVIVQPSLTSGEHARLLSPKPNSGFAERRARLRQLNTLLVSAETDCKQLQADMTVVVST